MMDWGSGGCDDGGAEVVAEVVVAADEDDANVDDDGHSPDFGVTRFGSENDCGCDWLPGRPGTKRLVHFS